MGIFSFLSNKKSILLLIFFELISLVLIINAHDYSQTKIHSIQTEVSGTVHQNINYFKHYLSLAKVNDSLQLQNAKLLQEIHQNKSEIQTPNLRNQFEFIPGFVIANQYTFDNNTIMINQGESNGIEPGMGVIATNGIVGVVQQTSNHFAKLISILNKKSKISVSVKNTNYTGFLQWENNDPNILEIIDMPENAEIKKGDTIVTGGMSNIFPKGIFVGSILDFKVLPGQKSYKIKLRTFMDMTDLGPVYVIKNNYKKEFDSISNTK